MVVLLVSNATSPRLIFADSPKLQFQQFDGNVAYVLGDIQDEMRALEGRYDRRQSSRM